METELKKITELINQFNKEDFKFELNLTILKKEKQYMKLGDIMQIVCRKTNLTPEYLCMKTREQSIVLPRQICHFIASKNTKHSLKSIGAYFGNKDHATVLHSIRTIQGYIDTDRAFRGKYLDLINCGRLIHTNDNCG